MLAGTGGLSGSLFLYIVEKVWEYTYIVDDVNLLSNAGELCDRQIFG